MKKLKTIDYINICYMIVMIGLTALYLLRPGTAYIFKSLPSGLFVLGGLFNLLYAYKYTKKFNAKYSTLMLIGLIFACAGDIFLIDFFEIGAGLFAVGHIFYVLAYCTLSKFKVRDLIASVIIFALSACFVFASPLFNLSIFNLCLVLIYALVISFMVGKSFGNLYNSKIENYKKWLIFFGSIMFFLSDFMLLLVVFGGLGFIFDVFCLAFYYPAQVLLSVSILYVSIGASDKNINIFKVLWCRIYQFIFKLVMPLMPWRIPTIIQSQKDVVDVLNQHEVKRVLLVTDKGISKLGLTENLQKYLKKAKVEVTVFDDVIPNPTITNIENGLNVFKQNNCQGIIAFGGGSVMDCAKMIGARVVKPKKPVKKMKGLLKINKHLPLLIAVPTTAGTGSEVTVTAVITDDKTHEKYTINDFSLIPHYAVLDASVTLGLPPSITGTTGMDALTHAIEAYIGGATTAFTRRMSIDAVKLIFQNILKVYEEGSNLQARQNMLTASYYAGLAFTRSYVGYVHAIAHTLGGKYGISHGLANAVILPIVLEDYGKNVYKKLGTLAKQAGLVSITDTNEEAAIKFIENIKYLNKQMNIPQNLPEIELNDIKQMATLANKEANPLYPVPVVYTKKQLEILYKKVSGK